MTVEFTSLKKAEHPMQALAEYEAERLPKTAEIARASTARADRSG